MKATVKLYLNDGSKASYYPVKLIITHRGKIKRHTLGHSLLVDWNEVQQLPRRSHPDFEILYGQIQDVRAKCVKMAFTELTDLGAALNFLNDSVPVAAQMDFFEFGDEMVNQMVLLGRHGNASAYACALAQLKIFIDYLPFENIDTALLENFKRHKKLNGLKNTSIKTYLTELRAVYNRAKTELLH
jgi:hypothetical protein